MSFSIDNFIKQMNLLNERVSYREIKSYKNEEPFIRDIKIRIERSLPFEFVEGMINSYLNIWRTNAQFTYSSYDSSFSSPCLDEENDCYLYWIDWRLYREKMGPLDAVEWIIDRIKELKTQTKKIVFINNWPDCLSLSEQLFNNFVGDREWYRALNNELHKKVKEIVSCEIIDIALIASKMGFNSYDMRNDLISNYPFSNSFTIEVARHLALRLLPATTIPRLKAVVLDLDNTLYKGVLGEDGWEGISIEEGHLLVQQVLLDLKRNGILLAICSKNEKQDVEEMFRNKGDFLLKIDDFSFIKANWNDKAHNISLIAKSINIDTSAILFIDDNIAELSSVKSVHSEINLLLADNNGQETVHRLLNYPGLFNLKKDDLASIRGNDIKANQLRLEMQENSKDQRTYLEKLKMKIKIYENTSIHQSRIYELSQKTNQFNLAIKRFSEQKINEIFNDENYKIYTIELSDILNNSGIIGVFICKIQDDKANFEEILFSCRALGRDVESVSLHNIVLRLISFGVNEISFDKNYGTRNTPATNWIKEILDQERIKVSTDELAKLLMNRLEAYPAEVICKYESKFERENC